MRSPRRRWRLLLNGKAADDRAVHEAIDALRDGGVSASVGVTREPGDAARLVAQALADGVDTVVAGGGDGTLHAVASALAASEGDAGSLPSLGVLPLGTANDFATAAGIPEAPAQALSLVASTRARPVDLLRVRADGHEAWVLNLASGGFGTEVTVETPEGMKRLLGSLAYVVTGVARLGRIETVQARLRGPDFEWQGGFIVLAVGNGRQAGGGQALCPDAWIDDGALDLSLIPGLEGEVLDALQALVGTGQRAALDRVAVRARLPWVEFDAPEALMLNLDGEPIEASSGRIDCVPGRLRMHLPPDCPLLAPSPDPGGPRPGA